MNQPIPSESMEIPHSEANPEPTPVETPEATPSPEVPEEGTPVEPEVDPENPEPENPEPENPEGELYELPDGRKVDGATLAKEWKENFLPDYTRKSQELSTYKNTPGNQLPTEATPENKFADPDYVPQSYEEILAEATNRAVAQIKGEQQAEADAYKAAEDAVVEQLNKVKEIDPNVDENKLFLHANKYGFRDLPTAYQNMKDMGMIAKTVQKQTVENINKRKDPVSVSNGAPVGTPPDPSGFESAAAYLRSLKS